MFKPANYPVQWRNVDGQFEVTITLPELRPKTPVELEGDDVVLVVSDPALSTVPFTWTATAEPHGAVFEDGPIDVEVVEESAIGALRSVLDASTE